jgi:hypothetical protein
MNRRGRLPSAAGRSLPGTSPTLALSSPQPSPQIARFGSPSNRHSRKTACRAGGHRSGPAISNRHAALSNRHLVRLEITATRAESTTSLFLIDPNQRQFSRVDYSKPGPKSQRNFFEGGGLDGVGCYAQRRFWGRRALEAGSCKDETSARRPESNVVESGSRRDGGTLILPRRTWELGFWPLAAGGTKHDEVLLFQKFLGG